MDTSRPPFGPVPGGRDPEEYDRLRRRVLWSMPTGLYVVGSRAGERVNLMTANWVMQVATTPKLVAVSVQRDAVTRRLIEQGGGFSVSILTRQDRAVVRRFVKPVEEVQWDRAGKLAALQGQPVFEVAGGLPCLVGGSGWLACEVRHVGDWSDQQETAAGRSSVPASHVLFVGEVVDAGEASGTRASEPGSAGQHSEVLRMEDTRMNYGG